MANNQKSPVRVGICGLGTVGKGTFSVLSRNIKEICNRAGKQIVVSRVATSREHPDLNLEGVAVSRDVHELVRSDDVDIVVELIGGTTVAKTIVLEAMKNGKHVVTANKALVAEFGNELFACAREFNVSLSFEAAVAGGIPIIKALREGLAANKVDWLAGIINGTGNFILSEMRDKGRAFADVLREAQEKGYAEADPTFDVEGIDAAHKLVILAAIAFDMPLQFDKVFTEGISKIEPLDVSYAAELGYCIKHLGVAVRRETGVEMRVHPTLIPRTRLIANVDGVMNAVVVKGDAVGPTLYYGAGAGAEPTASSVIADIIVVSKLFGSENLAPLQFGLQAEGQQAPEILSIEESICANYLRFTAQDKPGVLSEISKVFSDAEISIEALVQKEPKDGESDVPIVILTNRANDKALRQVLEKIEALSSVQGQVVRIRVESLK